MFDTKDLFALTDAITSLLKIQLDCNGVDVVKLVIVEFCVAKDELKLFGVKSGANGSSEENIKAGAKGLRVEEDIKSRLLSSSSVLLIQS